MALCLGPYSTPSHKSDLVAAQTEAMEKVKLNYNPSDSKSKATLKVNL